MALIQQIGRFRILSEEGAGGMGVIYLGHDDRLGRKAAVKVLNPHRWNDPKAVERFRREATAAARLKHPNIAALYEMGEHDNRPFLAIEWVEGRSLEEVLAQGPLPLPRAMRIIEQVLLTLDYAHSHGVVHRDVKPANLMISATDHVTVVDFGLAFLLSEPGITSTGVLFGTPLYLAPEMAGDEDVDGRADLYSAALVFFEMITGSPPFGPAAPAEMISQHLHAPRPSVLERKPDLPPLLEPVLEKAMAVDRDRRYPSGAALLEALKQAVGAAPPPPRRSRAWPFAAIGMSLLAIGLWLVSPTTTPAPRESPAPPEDWAQVGGGPGREFEMYGALKQPVLRWRQPAPGASHVLVSGGRLVVAGPSSVETRRAATGQLLWKADQGGLPLVGSGVVVLDQGKTWRGLSLLDGRELWQQALPAASAGGALGDDGYVYAGVGSSLWSLDPEDGAEEFKVELGEPVQLAPVARGMGVFVALKSRVVAVDSLHEKVVWSWRAPAVPSALALPSDNRLLVAAGEELDVLSPLSGTEAYDQAWLDSAVLGIASSSGRAAVVNKERVALYSLPGTGNVPLWTVPLPAPPAGPPLTDGTQVLLATQKGELLCLEGGQVSWRLELEGPCHSSPVPAGSWLYVLAGGQLSAYQAP